MKTDRHISGATIAAASMREDVFGASGLSTKLQLSPIELSEFRRLITKQWLDRIADLYPAELVHQFRQNGLPYYHRLADRIDHKALWTKKARLLPSASVAQIRDFEFIRSLEEEFGAFNIANESGMYPEEICWRIVRPDTPEDVGPVHMDAWFWELGHGITPPGAIRVKVWIPFYCEPGLNGLKVLPGSHHHKWPYHSETRDGLIKPRIEADEQSLPMQLLNIAPGTAVVFNDRLLHGGALNTGATTRVSCEFTIFVTA